MKNICKKKATIKIITGLSMLFMFSESQAGDNLMRIVNLKGEWNFTIGMQEDWIKPGFDDSEWKKIYVPSAWENQGFHGYDGYATYRKEFTLPEKYEGSSLYLFLGYIDDVDITYLNGHKIGLTGTFPPDYQSAYYAKRLYFLPQEYLNFGGKNVISVQVYDSYMYGGIVKGDPGIYVNEKEIPLTVNLQGEWKFKTGDDFERTHVKYDDTDWIKIFVPGSWEDQGFRDYDGFAWYRKRFYYKGNLTDDKIVLIMGKIDDVDQVYVNGLKVGDTGGLTKNANERVDTKGYYSNFRAYLMNSGVLEKNKWNTIAVRVYDSGGVGGIYEGPVGFVNQQDFIKYWKNK